MTEKNYPNYEFKFDWITVALIIGAIVVVFGFMSLASSGHRQEQEKALEAGEKIRQVQTGR